MVAFGIFVTAGQDYPADMFELESKLQDMTPFLEAVGEIVNTELASNFATGAFVPLASATLARKAAEGSPMDILVRSGALKDAAGTAPWSVSSGGGGAIAEKGVPGYGGFHLDGTQYMPVRDWAFLDDGADIPILSAFLDFIYG